MACGDFPDKTTGETLLKDATTINEIVTSPDDLTNPASDGKQKETLVGLSKKFGVVIVGNYANGTVLNDIYNGASLASNGTYWAPVNYSDLPITIDATTYPKPEDHVPALRLYGDVNSSNISTYTDLVFDSVADMTNSLSLVLGTLIDTKGYYSPGDGGGAKYLVVNSGTGVSDGGVYIDLNSGFQALLVSDVTSKRYGMVGSGDESEKMKLLCSSGRKITMQHNAVFTFDSTVLVPDGVDIDLNGCTLIANHSGALFKPVNAPQLFVNLMTAVNGTMKSISGMGSDFIGTNFSMEATNTTIDMIHFETWGADAFISKGGCRVIRMTFDDIRDNPVSSSLGNTYYGSVTGGSCEGDGILLKGNNNIVELFIAKDVGLREGTLPTDPNYVAGSLVVCGADGDRGENNYVGYAECDRFGALLLGIEGDRNKIGTLKARTGYYADQYPGPGSSTRPVETANINGSENNIDKILVTESVARGYAMGSGGKDCNLESLDIGEILIGPFINIDTALNTDNSVNSALCGKAPNENFLRINGDGFVSDRIKLKIGTGGGIGSNITANYINISSLVHNCDQTSSTGKVYTLSGGGSIGYLEVTGADGTLVENHGISVGRYNLLNKVSSYESILILRDSKFTVMNSKIEDIASPTRPPLATGATASVIYANNISPDIGALGGATVVNQNNI